MLVNYKFEIQVKLQRLTYFFDNSVDIELSTFECLGNLPFLGNYLRDVKEIYYTYFNYSDDICANQLDRRDLDFLLFLEKIKSVKFDNIKFNGDFVNVLSVKGDFYLFNFLINEG